MLKLSLKQFLITFVPAIIILIIVVLGNIIFQINIPSMTRDVSTLGGIHPFAGFVSSLGILLWCTTATISFFSAFVIQSLNLKEYFWFLISSGGLSLYLLFDDLFLFHELLHSKGYNEKIIFGIIGVSIFIYLAKFKLIIVKSNFTLLLLALGFLSASVAVDSIQPYFWDKNNLHAFIEDGTKWLGIVSWCSYFINTAFDITAIKNNNIE